MLRSGKCPCHFPIDLEISSQIYEYFISLRFFHRVSSWFMIEGWKKDDKKDISWNKIYPPIYQFIQRHHQSIINRFAKTLNVHHIYEFLRTRI